MKAQSYAILPFKRGNQTYRIRRYRERAEMLRRIAGDVIATECRDMLMGLANAYEGMAAHELVPPADRQCFSLLEARQWT